MVKRSRGETEWLCAELEGDGSRVEEMMILFIDGGWIDSGKVGLMTNIGHVVQILEN